MKSVFDRMTTGAGLYISLTIMILVAITLHVTGLDARANAVPLLMFGMAEIKSMASIKDKWGRVTPGRSEDYKIGVNSPRRDWQASTEAGADNWREGTAQAAAKGMFSKGVSKAGTAKWKAKTLAKGPQRFSEGVFLAGDDYQKGFEPYRNAISGVDLGPRFPRRDPRNIDRVRKVVTALVEAKLAQ